MKFVSSVSNWERSVQRIQIVSRNREKLLVDSMSKSPHGRRHHYFPPVNYDLILKSPFSLS